MLSQIEDNGYKYSILLSLMLYITLIEHNKAYGVQTPGVQPTSSQTDVTNLTKQKQDISWEIPTTFSTLFQQLQ